MQKLALGIEYDGSSYCGWQVQRNMPSVQACIEHALGRMTSESVKIFCAGRTDSGVHALGQVIHFETSSRRSQVSWVLGVNSYLPPSICVHWVKLMSRDFHARFSAISRRYCYIIYNNYIRSALLRGKFWHYKKYLDTDRMHNSAQCLLGENDFASFCASGCQSYSTRRKLYHIRIIRKGKYVIIDVEADSFIYRMVRNIVGSLVQVGSGAYPEKWILELLKNCNRSLAGVTAPASGLYLVEVKYPTCFSVPSFC